MYCKLRGKDNVLFVAALCEISGMLAINSGLVVITEEGSFTGSYIFCSI